MAARRGASRVRLFGLTARGRQGGPMRSLRLLWRAGLLAAAALISPGLASSGEIRVEKLLGLLADGGPVEVTAGQAIVKFSSAATAAQREAALAGLGGRTLQELPMVGSLVVELPPGMSVASGLAILRGLPGVLAAHPNLVYRPTRVPNDPSVSAQFALSQINAFAGWEFEVGTSCRATVVVMDAGIEATQTDLAGKLVAGASRVCNDACAAGAEPTQVCNHGTRVAGIAAATTDNGSGIAGMSWGAQLISVRIFDAGCNPGGNCPTGCLTNDARIINGLAYARGLQNTAAVGKVVVNLSVGGAGACPVGVGSVKEALDLTVAAGIPVAISAGNDGSSVNVPANCATAAGGSGIIPVGMTDSNNNVDSRSSRGPELSANGVVAPGVAVRTTDLGGGTAEATGTSFSAPHVAGLSALILSAKPGFTAAQVQGTIRSAADGIGGHGLGLFAGEPLGNVSGSGRINAFRAMRLAVRGTLSDFDGDKKAIAFPNPFRPSQTPLVSLSIPTDIQGAKPNIKVYTVSGELVRELAGLTWDGKNKSGQLVASGTYIFAVSTDNGNTTGRVAVIR